MQIQRFVLVFSLLAAASGCALPVAPMCCPPCPPMLQPPISPYGRFPGPVAPLPVLQRPLQAPAIGGFSAAPVPRQWSPPVQKLKHSMKSLWPVTATYTSHYDPNLAAELSGQCHCEKCRAKRKKQKHHKHRPAHANHQHGCAAGSCQTSCLDHVCATCSNACTAGCDHKMGGHPGECHHTACHHSDCRQTTSCGSSVACSCGGQSCGSRITADADCGLPNGPTCAAPASPTCAAPDGGFDGLGSGDLRPAPLPHSAAMPPPGNLYDEEPDTAAEMRPMDAPPEPVPPPAPLPTPEDFPPTDPRGADAEANDGSAERLSTDQPDADAGAPDPTADPSVDANLPMEDPDVTPISHTVSPTKPVDVMIIPSTVVERKRYQ